MNKIAEKALEQETHPTHVTPKPLPPQPHPTQKAKPPKGYGHLFVQRRKSLKLSLEEISSILRIQVRYLQAIEENKFKELPERVFTLGFIRSYAQYIGLDSMNIMNQYRPLILPKPSSVKKSSKKSDSPAAALLFSQLPQWVLVVVSAALLCLTVWAWSQASKDATPAEVEDVLFDSHDVSSESEAITTPEDKLATEIDETSSHAQKKAPASHPEK